MMLVKEASHSVNELVDRIQDLHGQPVEVVGLLTFEFENTSIGHFPKAERRESGDDIDLPLYQSSAWLAFGSGSMRANERVLARWNGKRVRVTGIAYGLRGLGDAGILEGGQLRGLIEFSRAVHAEMHALLNAGAKHGSQVRGGKLFVTTYPCHSCARHIVAAGIEEVYFLEPYRKSLATKLHSDSITEREADRTKVRILPFDGVAPSRFLKFFSTHDGGRKDSTGKMKVRAAFPVTAITLEAIPKLEALAVRSLQFGQPQNAPPADGAGAGRELDEDR